MPETPGGYSSLLGPLLNLVRAMVATTTLACTMVATAVPIASIKAYGLNTSGG